MIGFLIKGLLRDRSRSLFPILMVSAGVFLTVFLYSWMQGIIGDMVDTNARLDTGHVKIMTRAYNELSGQMPNDLALLGVGKILEELKSNKPDMYWTPRVRFGGLIDIPDEKGVTRAQAPVMGMGIDLLSSGTKEPDMLNLKKAVTQGALPQKSGEMLISEDLARKLRLNIGDTATLISATMHGSMATYNFKVVGMIRFGIIAMDRAMIITDFADTQNALDMADGTSEILGYAGNMVYNDDKMKLLAKNFNAEYSKKDDRFSPIMLCLSDQNGLSDMLDRSTTIGGIIILVFMFAMSIVLWNSGLMNNLRRYGEIGLRLALGEYKGELYRRMIAESFVIGVIGSVIGTLLGLAASYYLQNHGLDMSSFMEKSTIIISSKIRAEVTPVSYIIGFIPGIIAPVLGTIASGIGVYTRQTAQLFKELEI